MSPQEASCFKELVSQLVMTTNAPRVEPHSKPSQYIVQCIKLYKILFKSVLLRIITCKFFPKEKIFPFLTVQTPYNQLLSNTEIYSNLEVKMFAEFVS
jgi:hypothetical protein